MHATSTDERTAFVLHVVITPTPAVGQVRDEHDGASLSQAICNEVQALLDSLGLTSDVTLEAR